MSGNSSADSADPSLNDGNKNTNLNTATTTTDSSTSATAADEVPLDSSKMPSMVDFSNEGVRKILAATRAFQSLPSAGPSWDLQKSYPEFNRAMKLARNKLIPLMSSLLKHANIPPEDFRAGDVDEKFDFLVEANDELLERIGKSLDEADGIFNKAETVVVRKEKSTVALNPPGTWGKRKALEEQADPEPINVEPKNRLIKKATVKRVVREKPQLKFKTPVDNSISPFIPKLKDKPNSIKPLSILPEYNIKNEEYYGHPYLVELNKWEPLDSMLTKVNPTFPRPLESTPLHEIYLARDIELLLAELYPCTEIAIDLEHHSYRSFLGFTCLMQISTRKKDYIIDTLELRDHLHLLNEIFTNPKIVKVFHGSASDIEWLQKDFGLYIVNMFDTQVAAKLLGHQYLSLQALVDKYCGISLEKTFQLADWRIRPLPKDMLHYARQDTHSLLYMYDLMRNELVDAGNERNNLLIAAYDQSKVMCLKRYEKPGNNPKLAVRKMRRSLNNRQVYAFMELYKWRDQIARERDESIAYVLPNHMLLMISEQLPKEMTGILACCDPVPPLVHSGLGLIHKIVTVARELPLQDNTSEEKSDKRKKLKDWVVLMNSVHDVGLSEITKISLETEEIEEEESMTENLDTGFDLQRFQEILTTKSWPMKLKDPVDMRGVQASTNPSVFFNSKLKQCQLLDESKLDSKTKHYEINSTTTAFDRYQLSKEIMEILHDPIKKDALDMENPIVKAVYETAFCDPTEQSEIHEEEALQKPEKVFTEGEFIPFNPLAQPNSSKSRKRKRKNSEWDDSTQLPQDTGESSEINTPLVCLDLDDTDDNTDTTEIQIKSNSTADAEAPQNEKSKHGKKKKSNFLNNLKNPFAKKKKDTYQNMSNYNTEEFAPKRRKLEDDQPQENHSRRNQNRNSTNSRENSRSGRGGGRNNSNSKNSRGRGRGGNFFNFQGRGGGSKSMTFK